MNKKVIALIVVIILIAIIGSVAYFMSQNSNESSDNTQGNLLEENETNVVENNTQATEETISQGGKTLIAYFSASGNTENVANKLAQDLGADIFKIEPVDEYT